MKDDGNKETAGSEFLAYCGAHYSSCPVEIREIWARVGSSRTHAAVLRQIFQKHAEGAHLEIVPISTCNRFDVCVFGRISFDGLSRAFAELGRHAVDTGEAAQADRKNLAILTSPEKLKPFLRCEFDQDGLRLLFRVGASLDSLVLGEPHILGQLKVSFAEALEANLCGSRASKTFNRCFHVAKRVRTETSLGKNGISIGHAAVEVTKRIFDDLRQCNVLMIGAGEMGRIASQHFLTCGVTGLTIANRSLERAEALALELRQNGLHAYFADLDSALLRLPEFDITVVATGSTTYLVRPEHVRDFARKRAGRIAALVDISVPRNIDPAVAKVDNLFVFDIDDLDKVMGENRAARMSAAAHAETIIAGEIDFFLNMRKQRENLTSVGRFHSWIRTVVVSEIQRSQKRSREVRPEVVADAIAKKLVSHPAALARADVRISQLDAVGDLLERLFSLSTQPLLKSDPRTAGDTRTTHANEGSDDLDVVIPFRNISGND